MKNKILLVIAGGLFVASVLVTLLKFNESNLDRSDSLSLNRNNSQLSKQFRATPTARNIDSSQSVKDEKQIRSDARKSIEKILEGAPILDFYPFDGEYIEGHIFLEELEIAIKKEQKKFELVETILADLDINNNLVKKLQTKSEIDRGEGFIVMAGADKLSGLRKHMFIILSQLDSGMDPSRDLSKKIDIYHSFEGAELARDSALFFEEAGRYKSKGVINKNTFSKIDKDDQKFFIRGMAQSRDVDAISTVLEMPENENTGLLKFTVEEFMKADPKNSILFIDSLKNQNAREACLHTAVEWLHNNGATEEAKEWAQQLNRKSDSDE